MVPKELFFFLLAIFLATEVNAVDLPSALSERFTANALALLLKKRCTHFLGRGSDESVECQRTAELLVALLDQDVQVGTSGLQSSVSFRHELHNLLRQPAVIAFLQETNSALRLHSPHNPFNLWEWTVEYAHGQSTQALQWIAVLFQDTDAVSHTQYLRNRGFNGISGSISLLDDTNRMLATSRAVVLYPAMVRSEARSQYHFYVIAYLAHRLQAIQPQSSFNRLMPFLFNALYGYARYIESQDLRGRFRGAWGSWTGFDPTNHQDSMEDIYLGYAGATWGVGLSLCPLDQSWFGPRFSSDPEYFLRQWLGNEVVLNARFQPH